MLRQGRAWICTSIPDPAALPGLPGATPASRVSGGQAGGRNRSIKSFSSRCQTLQSVRVTFALKARMAAKMRNGFAVFSPTALDVFMPLRTQSTCSQHMVPFPTLRPPAKGCPKRLDSQRLGKKRPFGTAKRQQGLKNSHKIPACSSAKTGSSPF